MVWLPWLLLSTLELMLLMQILIRCLEWLHNQVLVR
jgi:hypothetical protein